MLWKKLKADDFDTDIIEVLRESNKKIREQLEGLSRDDFSEVFLFFDYDAHQTNLGNLVPSLIASSIFAVAYSRREMTLVMRSSSNGMRKSQKCTINILLPLSSNLLRV